MSEALEETKTHYRACHLCEAICGLTIVTQDEVIVSIKGDPDDPLSRGHICPKAIALQDLHSDPDRLREPMRKVDGQWQKMDWREAYEFVATQLSHIQTKLGNDSVGIYSGNPNVHNYGHMTHGPYFSRLLKTKNRFSATSVDQLPQHLIAYWMYGHQFLLPIPDIDHTDLLLIIGANPIVSNGSLMTAPDIRNRLKAIRAREGKIIVIDPRKTETAKIADSYLPVRPGTDAALLLSLINEIFRVDAVNPGHLEGRLTNFEFVEEAVTEFSADSVADYTGVTSSAIKLLAKELIEAKSAAIYGRLGVSTHDFGTLCHWAIQMLNLITGNLDSVGGVMLTDPAINPAGPEDRQKGHFGRWHSRVRKLPEFSKELPCSVMAEEITTAGEGQIRALITVAGNPVLSTPSGHQLESALDSLDFMVSIDPYINETTRHADIILPPASPLVHEHYDLAFHRLAIRNTTRFNPAVFKKPENERYDWQIFSGLAEAFARARELELKAHATPAQLIKMWIDNGPYAEASDESSPLDFDSLLSSPHGIDLGPLKSSLLNRLCTEDNNIQCLNPELMPEFDRLLAKIKKNAPSEQLLLIGRREVRTNNSWMHNSFRLVKGKPRCLLLMHPEDLEKHQIKNADTIRLRSNKGVVQVEVKASEDMMSGVVSLPHGWGHSRKGIKLSVASEHAGVSLNDLTDWELHDGLSGNAVLSGVPVTIEKLSANELATDSVDSSRS